MTGIDVSHPFRDAKAEREALDHIFAPVRKAVRRNHCTRAILVGHNASFDLGFLNAAVARFNAARESFPAVLFAGALGFAEADFHRLDASEQGTVDQVPRIGF